VRVSHRDALTETGISKANATTLPAFFLEKAVPGRACANPASVRKAGCRQGLLAAEA
jgi:hypothetical protein